MNHEDKIKELEAITDKESLTEDQYYSWGYSLLQLGQYNEAILKFMKVLQILPDNSESMNFISEAYIGLNDLSNALVYSKKAIESFSESPEYYANLGDIYRALGRNKDAAEAYEKGLEFILPNEEAHIQILDGLEALDK